MGARRPGTRSAYNSAWKRWSSWCTEQSLDPFSAPVASVVDFLADLENGGMSYSAINGYRSAISALHNGISGVPVGQHLLVKQVMSGIWNNNPSKPKYEGTWDVDIVLRYIHSLGNNEMLSDKMLTHKLATLLPLSTAARASELSALTLEHFADNGNEIIFSIPSLTKTRSQGKQPTKIAVKWFESDLRLCPVTCVRTYILRTSSWRKTTEQHKLFLTTVGKHTPVATSTISGWMVKMLSEAGIDTTVFKGHSLRSASTSKAAREGLSVADIVSRANWSNAKTFRKFYCRDKVVQKKPFEEVVLSIK